MMVERSMLFFFAVSSIVEIKANRFIPSNFLKLFETDWRILAPLSDLSDSNAKFLEMRRFSSHVLPHKDLYETQLIFGLSIAHTVTNFLFGSLNLAK